ncbi:MAG: DUF1302 domain-containing protein [Pseudomonadota bacterium]
MKQERRNISRIERRPTREFAAGIAVILTGFATLPAAYAAEFDTDNPDLKLRWDNTVKYSAAYRLKNPSALLVSSLNSDDGDRNFRKGLISNRIDLLSEFDLTYHNLGARVSGAAWYDQVYNSGTDNDSPLTYNSPTVSNRDFPRGTRDLHGRKAELLDAFLFAKGTIGDMAGTVRAGRHALVYGESLFFGGNGIAAAQQPVDVVKGLSVPGTQFKELIMPVSQLSGQLQIDPNLAFGAYYQFRWEKNRLPEVGSYFSTADFLFDRAERLLVVPTNVPPFGALAPYLRDADRRPKDSGQGGVQIKWTPEDSGYDLGFYAARYHDKSPQTITRVLSHTYALAYHEGIRTYGLSASTTIGMANFAAEVSVRHNVPLVNAGSADLFGIVPAAFGGPVAPADNLDHPSYPVGRSAHAQLSWLATLPPSFLSREASLLGEVAWNRRTSVTKNAAALDPGATRDAWGMRLAYEASYRQAASGLDLSVPLGLSYFPKGRSSVITAFGPNHGGDMSVGINGVYLSSWYFGLSFTHYYGGQDLAVVSNPAGPLGSQMFTYKQSSKDRDFVSLSVRHTF